MSLVKKGAALLMVATMALSSAACSNSKTEGKPEAQEKVAPVEKNGDKTVIRFWHAMGGKTQGVLDGLVADYNKSQNKYEIKAEFQGTYEESLTKFRTMSATKEAPALVQSSEITTKYMIDSKKITPIDSWIKKDKYDTSKLEKAI
ncbi:ABC transporter substrate-binding protein, partial [Bacillus cereus]|nr:ABC transporter substrate-binding protein [Bacillus cereus]